MRIDVPHEWPDTAEAAIAVQERLRSRVRTEGAPVVRTVAGLDVSYAKDSDLQASAVVVLDAATHEVLDQVVLFGRSTFPYLPGLFAFRELPGLVAALTELDTVPDLLVCDGHGVAHPRRFGLACHLGVLTGLPSIGVAKTPMWPFEQPGPARGDSSPLRDRVPHEEGHGELGEGEVLGRVLRTRDGIKPVFVSVGHRIGLDEACAEVLRATGEYRLPEPIRQADQAGRRALAQHAVAAAAAVASGRDTQPNSTGG